MNSENLTHEDAKALLALHLRQDAHLRHPETISLTELERVDPNKCSLAGKARMLATRELYATGQEKLKVINGELEFEFALLRHVVEREEQALIYERNFKSLIEASPIDLNDFEPEKFLSHLFREDELIFAVRQLDEMKPPQRVEDAEKNLGFKNWFWPFPVDGKEHPKASGKGTSKKCLAAVNRWPYAVMTFSKQTPIAFMEMVHKKYFPVTAITSSHKGDFTVYFSINAKDKEDWYKKTEALVNKVHANSEMMFAKKFRPLGECRLPTVKGIPRFFTEVDIVWLDESVK